MEREASLAPGLLNPILPRGLRINPAERIAHALWTRPLRRILGPTFGFGRANMRNLSPALCDVQGSHSGMR
jgi:hypothetical protein